MGDPRRVGQKCDVFAMEMPKSNKMALKVFVLQSVPLVRHRIWEFLERFVCSTSSGLIRMAHTSTN